MVKIMIALKRSNTQVGKKTYRLQNAAGRPASVMDRLPTKVTT